MQPALSITPNSITAIFDLTSPPLVLVKGSAQFSAALDAVKNQDWGLLKSCFSLSNIVAKITLGKVVISDKNEVFYNGKLVHNYIVTRIQQMLEAELPITPLLSFLNNVMERKDDFVKEELLKFLEVSGCPLTEDGYFLAYKRVQSNYNSFHSNLDGTYNNNKIGSEVSMLPKDVDFNRNNVCSKGLHFCAFNYLHNYHTGQGRVMVVKINPKDVACFPTDYTYAKARCTKYLVVAEVKTNDQEDILKDNLLFAINEAGIKYWNHRDSKGRFVKK